MKKLILTTIILTIFATTSLLAQNPVPQSDTVENPVQEGDPAVRSLPPRLDYTDDRVKITPEEVPDAVRETLESSAQYTDWQKASVFHDKNKDEFIVEFTEKGRTTSYRFSKDGQAIIEEQ
jgi:hypothetical protein